MYCVLIICLWNMKSAVTLFFSFFFLLYEWGTKEQFSQDFYCSSKRTSVKILTLIVQCLRCIYLGGFCSSKMCRCGCGLGAGDWGGTQHTSYGAPLPLHTFSRAKVCTSGTQFRAVLWKEWVRIQTSFFFNHFSPRSVCFIVCSNSVLAFYC